MDKKEALQIQKNKKPIDLREEYFVSDILWLNVNTIHSIPQRLQMKNDELDNWENKRIPVSWYNINKSGFLN